MSDEPTQILVRPEVAAFVEDVRRLLADLDDETRDELTGGLEADLSDQLADGTPLGDPRTYAAELRAAAGLPDRARGLPRPSFPDLRAPGAMMDHYRARFFTLAERPRVLPSWEVVSALRPAWWVLRAWLAVVTLDVMTGPRETLTVVPTLGAPFLGEAVLVVAIVVSTLVGLGRLWPGAGPDRPATARILLLALNAAALLSPALWNAPWPGTSHHEDWRAYDHGYADGSRAERNGLRLDGDPIHNVYAYDAQGRPIERVQLFDEDGDPIAIDPGDTVTGRRDNRTVGCPARNGDVGVYNVFPLDQLELRRGTCAGIDDPEATTPEHPLASVPPVTHVRSPRDEPSDPRRAPGPDRRP